MRPIVKLMNKDGNVFSIIGVVVRSLRDCGLEDLADEFKEKALVSKSYDAVLQLAMEYCNIE